MQHSLLGGIRTKLIASFLIVALSPLLLLAFINKQTTEKALTDNAKQAQSAAANETANRIDTFIDGNLNSVRVEALLPGLARYLSLTPKQRNDSPQMQLATETLIRLSRKDMVNILFYALLDLNGKNVLDTYTPNIGKDESAEDYFKKPLQTGLSFVSSMKKSPTIPDLVTLFFSSPVRNAKGDTALPAAMRYILKAESYDRTGATRKIYCIIAGSAVYWVYCVFHTMLLLFSS